MYFMTIDAVKFRKPVTPGDQLVIEVVPLRKGKIFKMKGECRVDGAVVSSAEFMATLAERPKA
jgi:3-hydroxyacyl-[acyl-carrier-protein] dehydratase